MEDIKRAPRRSHSTELRSQVLSECAQPGASVAAVSMAHGLNANLVRKWQKAGAAARTQSAAPTRNTGEFVALTLAQPSTPLSPGDIRIELRRGTTTMSIHWPILGGGECAAWLREWLR
jgi:transposase